MITEDVATISLAPFIRIFTYAVIKSLKVKNLTDQKYTIHADMVPKFSEKIIRASLGERTNIPAGSSLSGMNLSIEENPGMEFPRTIEEKVPAQVASALPLPGQQIPSILDTEPVIEDPVPIVQNQGFVQPPAPRLPPAPMPQAIPIPVQQPQVPQPPMRQPLMSASPQRNMRPPIPEMPPMQQMAPPEADEGEVLTQFYGKITPLLDDPSVSVIDCAGMGKPVMIIRRGQRQPSKIVLSEKDIRQVLDKVSEAAHIPLLDGVFRAAVDTFSINAVISEMIGSRFVIKKQPPMPQDGMGMSPGMMSMPPMR